MGVSLFRTGMIGSSGTLSVSFSLSVDSSLSCTSEVSLTTLELRFMLPRSRERSVEVSSVVVPAMRRLVPDCLLVALFRPSSLRLDMDSWSELVLSNPGGGDRDSTTEAALVSNSSSRWSVI